MRRIGRFRYGLIVVWPAQWLTIAESVVGILTLGYYVPGWAIDYMFWACKRWMR